MAGRRSHRVRDFLYTLLFCAVLAIAAAWFARLGTTGIEGTPDLLDGDSLMLEGVEIRFWGIDAPELGQRCQKDGQPYPCGRRALDSLRGIIDGQTVFCEGWETDKYDRLLAICRAGALEINRTMVQRGWAVAFGSYQPEEEEARRKSAGIWSGAFDEPSVWRKNEGSAHSSGWLGKLKFW